VIGNVQVNFTINSGSAWTKSVYVKLKSGDMASEASTRLDFVICGDETIKYSGVNRELSFFVN